MNEFVWTHLDRSKLPGGKMVRILDVAGVNVMDMTSEILNFIREVGNMLGHNYPERQALIYIVNVPPMFDMLWRMVQPFIRPVTRKKVRQGSCWPNWSTKITTPARTTCPSSSSPWGPNPVHTLC